MGNEDNNSDWTASSDDDSEEDYYKFYKTYKPPPVVIDSSFTIITISSPETVNNNNPLSYSNVLKKNLPQFAQVSKETVQSDKSETLSKSQKKRNRKKNKQSEIKASTTIDSSCIIAPKFCDNISRNTNVNGIAKPIPNLQQNGVKFSKSCDKIPPNISKLNAVNSNGVKPSKSQRKRTTNKKPSNDKKLQDCDKDGWTSVTHKKTTSHQAQKRLNEDRKTAMMIEDLQNNNSSDCLEVDTPIEQPQTSKKKKKKKKKKQSQSNITACLQSCLDSVPSYNHYFYESPNFENFQSFKENYLNGQITPRKERIRKRDRNATDKPMDMINQLHILFKDLENRVIECVKSERSAQPIRVHSKIGFVLKSFAHMDLPQCHCVGALCDIIIKISIYYKNFLLATKRKSRFSVAVINGFFFGLDQIMLDSCLENPCNGSIYSLLHQFEIYIYLNLSRIVKIFLESIVVMMGFKQPRGDIYSQRAAQIFEKYEELFHLAKLTKIVESRDPKYPDLINYYCTE